MSPPGLQAPRGLGACVFPPGTQQVFAKYFATSLLILLSSCCISNFLCEGPGRIPPHGSGIPGSQPPLPTWSHPPHHLGLSSQASSQPWSPAVSRAHPLSTGSHSPTQQSASNAVPQAQVPAWGSGRPHLGGPSSLDPATASQASPQQLCPGPWLLVLELLRLHQVTGSSERRLTKCAACTGIFITKCEARSSPTAKYSDQRLQWASLPWDLPEPWCAGGFETRKGRGGDKACRAPQVQRHPRTLAGRTSSEAHGVGTTAPHLGPHCRRPVLTGLPHLGEAPFLSWPEPAGSGNVTSSLGAREPGNAVTSILRTS